MNDPVAAAPTTVPAAPVHILAVDDDPDIGALLEMALGEVGGLTVTLAGSGEEALARAQVHRPDLVLLDVTMPGMDGFEIRRRLEALPGAVPIPVVFLTAKAMAAPSDEDAAESFLGTLATPLDPIAIADGLHRLRTDSHRRGDG